MSTPEWLSRKLLAAMERGLPVIAELLDAVSGGLPTFGAIPVGSDEWITVLTTPQRQSHWLSLSLQVGGASISFDGGTTVHLNLPSKIDIVLGGLKIPADSAVRAKNTQPGHNFRDFSLSVW